MTKYNYDITLSKINLKSLENFLNAATLGIKMKYFNEKKGKERNINYDFKVYCLFELSFIIEQVKNQKH